MLSGTVSFDEPADAVHGHPQHGVHVGGVEVVDLACAELVDHQEDGPGSEPAISAGTGVAAPSGEGGQGDSVSLVPTAPPLPPPHAALP